MKKLLLVFLLTINSSTYAGEFDLWLRAGGGLGFSDLKNPNEDHNSSHMFVGGIKPTYTMGNFELGLGVDVLKYKIKSDIRYPSITWQEAEHDNDNVLFSLSAKKILGDWKVGPYYGYHLDENILSVTNRFRQVVGVEADYALNHNWSAFAALEHSTDSGAKHRMGKIGISFRFGSPAKPMPAATYTCSTLHHTVYFDFDIDSMTKHEKEKLEKFLSRTNGKLDLEGHADEVGTEEYNMELSKRRADGVAEYIKTNHAHRINSNEHYGESMPADSLRWKNRRVDIEAKECSRK